MALIPSLQHKTIRHVFFLTCLLLAAMLSLNSCEKSCITANEICLEAPPTDELCQAYFVRWFYEKDSDRCRQIGYSGCTQRGFSNKEECDVCRCR
jgi:hypothetical protein